MNHIEVRNFLTPYGYEESYWVIDGKALPEYLELWSAELRDEYLTSMKPFSGLCPAWSKELNWQGDVRFVWKLIDMDTTILPLLLCEEDLDFSCIVIVVEVEKTKDFVYWNRVGYVLHENEDFEEEKKNGILNLEFYSDEDWLKYGDNIALENVGSSVWERWICKNWDEELYRRRMNYTLKYYQSEGNICWMKETNWVFDRYEYDCMVKDFHERETLRKLQNLSKDMMLDAEDCAKLLTDLTLDGKAVPESHRNDDGEILLHLLAGELLAEPLIYLLKNHIDKKQTICLYCKAMEVMWKNGDEAVKNVVDVTVLERISDEETVWNRFGTFIPDEFKDYINSEVLGWNFMVDE